MTTRKFDALWLGRRAYGEVLALQERLLAARLEDRVGDTVLFLEHEPVVTLGRVIKPEHLLLTDQDLAERGIARFETGRGGFATYHGPGQLVAYPIVDLAPDRQDVRRYVRDLAEVMIRMAADFGLGGGYVPDDKELVGVWVDKASPREFQGKTPTIAKIGAIGVRLSRWCTMHGFAFNGSTNLDEFRTTIVPCGIGDRGITSLAELRGESPSTRALADHARTHFGAVFAAEVAPIADRSDGPLSQIF